MKPFFNRRKKERKPSNFSPEAQERLKELHKKSAIDVDNLVDELDRTMTSWNNKRAGHKA